MSKPLEILKKYWNHDAFRTSQEEIIESVLTGNDTFALLPTGGGKSICFQVPAMMLDGICLVISPLVALMKDQVHNLQNKGIKAIALTGGIHQNEIIELLDNCQFGNYKFLYLSPERLQSDWIIERIKNLPINCIAIDESHCVSQWGNDFRPAYLKIVQLKEYFPRVPFIALTASATARVQKDIIEKLELDNPQQFKESFVRKNLAYMVFESEDKLFFSEQILKKYPEPAIVYVTNRKSCSEINFQLNSLGVKSTFYHGGLSVKEKGKNMQLWMEEKVQIMVATNAFGMGIDKANVKNILHLHLPQNLENYYQEAGRAGRNGEKAFATILINPSDSIHAESQFISVLPNKEELLYVYKKLCAFFQIAYGEGINEQFSLNINQFCQKYNLPTIKVYNAIQFLDRQGIVTLSQEFSEKISIQFIISSKEVIRYVSLNPNDEEIILTILRTYPGIYEMQTIVNLPLIVKKSGATEKVVLDVFEKLNQKEIIDYTSNKNDATITFNEIREDDKTINRVSKYLEAQNELKANQFQSVIHYINEKKKCKNITLMEYFGENIKIDCGICSYCISKSKTKKEIKLLENRILILLKTEKLNSRMIQKQTHSTKDDVIFAIQNLLEENKIILNPTNLYSLKK